MKENTLVEVKSQPRKIPPDYLRALLNLTFRILNQYRYWEQVPTQLHRPFQISVRIPEIKYVGRVLSPGLDLRLNPMDFSISQDLKLSNNVNSSILPRLPAATNFDTLKKLLQQLVTLLVLPPQAIIRMPFDLEVNDVGSGFYLSYMSKLLAYIIGVAVGMCPEDPSVKRIASVLSQIGITAQRIVVNQIGQAVKSMSNEILNYHFG